MLGIRTIWFLLFCVAYILENDVNEPTKINKQKNLQSEYNLEHTWLTKK